MNTSQIRQSLEMGGYKFPYQTEPVARRSDLAAHDVRFRYDIDKAIEAQAGLRQSAAVALSDFAWEERSKDGKYAVLEFVESIIEALNK